MVAAAMLWILPAVVPASASTLADKRREAARLEAQIDRSGEALSRATEDYNEARLETERMEARLSRAQRELDDAESQWSELRRQLGLRARSLYMRPGGWLLPFLGSNSVGELARGRALATSVMRNDQDLILETERARAEMEELTGQLREMRVEATSREQALRARRTEAQQALSSQRSLLSGVQQEIREIMEAQERRRLEEAARRAAEQRAAEARRAAEAPRAAEAQRSAPRRASGVAAPEPASARPVRASAGTAVQTARDQIGKPYRWGAAGPNEFDCSGLTKYSWAAAGVNLPHGSRAQYGSLPKVAQADLQPGDLVFFGNPIHHVGIYEGGGVMINSPQTGETVRRNSIFRRDYTGAARP